MVDVLQVLLSVKRLDQFREVIKVAFVTLRENVRPFGIEPFVIELFGIEPLSSNHLTSNHEH